MYVLTKEMRSASRACIINNWNWANAISSIEMELFKQKYGCYPELPFYAGEDDIKHLAKIIANKLFRFYLKKLY